MVKQASLTNPQITSTYLINAGNGSTIPTITSYKTLPTLITYEQLYDCTSCDQIFLSGTINNAANPDDDISFNNLHSLTNEYDCNCNKVLNYSYGRCMACTGITLESPGIQNSTQKKIQNVVRISSSLYTMNLGGLTSYIPIDQGKYRWNNMSDRVIPSVQKVTIPGSNGGAPSSKRTVTRNRPGAMSPGGIGVDIKHNSYERYLNRLKGQSSLRQQIQRTPPLPLQGNKNFKMGIISSCKVCITK